jgi:glycosyltransferase involved in cell wall biosynthesis
MKSDGTAPDIAVVVPTRNREHLVKRLLDRLDAIDDELAYELIVIDEGSSDGTRDMLERWRPARMTFRVIRHDPPKGLSAARNAGLAAATARYIAWIDDDDLTSPDRLRRQLALIEATGARWSCAARVDIDDDLAVIGAFACPPTERFLESLLAFNTLPTAAQGLLVERELALALGGYDETLDAAEDWEFCIRLALDGPPALLDEPLVGYRTGVASMSTDTERMDRAIAAVLEKHAHERRVRNVEPAWFDIHRSLLFSDVKSSRRAGVRRAWKMLRAQPSPKTLARCVWILVLPEKAAERSRRARIDQVPAAWRAQAERWLRPG